MKKLFLILMLSLFAYGSGFWKKENLYDPITMSYYIPFELWLQIPWDGKKKRVFKKLDKNHNIKGYYSWYHPYLKTHLKTYKKEEDGKSYLYTFYPKGIAMVFDTYGEVFLNNGIDFPAGFGWREGKIYSFSQEIWIKDKHYIRTTGIKIHEILFNESNILESLTFDFFINGTLKQSYTIQPIKK